MSELTQDDIRAWQQGRKSLSDLASIAGVSKQAISGRLKRRGITRNAKAGAVGTSSAPADPVAELMRSLEQATDREDWLRRAAAFIDSATLNLVAQAHTAAIGGSPTLGPQAIKALVAALSAAVDTLQRTSDLAAPDEADRAVLRVEVMSPELERQIRADAEAEALAFDHRDPDQPDSLSEHRETSQAGANAQTATHLAEDAEPPSAAGKSPSSDHALADQLARVADRQGVRRLRQLALSVGCAAPRDRDALIAALTEHADYDPDASAAIQAAIPSSS